MENPPNDPFAARPVLLPYVRTRVDEKGRFQVKQAPPPGRGVRGFLARHFSMFPSRRIYLDEQGSYFWKQIDGHQTLGDIEARLREHYRLESRQSRMPSSSSRKC